jgi:electron transfer flavoprotein alpha subunit
MSDAASPRTFVGEPSTRPLRIAALVKQVPVAETLELGDDGRLVRAGVSLEMNPYCRRAVAKGVELARATGGTCTALTLGPPSADDTLREAVAWGADDAVHLCDPAFAGSDTLATARALSAALVRLGPFDLVLAGLNTIDGETGQIGPEIAQLLDLPFASGVRQLAVAASVLALELELDNGVESVQIDLPAVLSVAERLCEPCKVDATGRAAVDPGRITVLAAADLGTGPWGLEGSPTSVGGTRAMTHERMREVMVGTVGEQVDAAVALLVGRGAFARGDAAPGRSHPAGTSTRTSAPSPIARVGPCVCVVVEDGRVQLAQELVGAAADLSAELGGSVTVLCPEGFDAAVLGGAGASTVLELVGSKVAEDVAAELIAWVVSNQPGVVLAPSTSFGREVAGRAAAATGSGLVGDAVALHVREGQLVAMKPAFAGALLAEIACHSSVQFATVRPGVLPIREGVGARARREQRTVVPRGRVRELSASRHEIESLTRAEVVIGVGAGVRPDEYDRLEGLRTVLGAAIAATRKVTDKGWMPRTEQVGLTGRSISPRLYVAIGVSGKFNHMIGVRSADSILAINVDPSAPVFEFCDVGIVGDWREVLPALEQAVRHPGPLPVRC